MPGPKHKPITFECSRCRTPNLTGEDFYWYFVNGRNKPRHVCKNCMNEMAKVKTGIRVWRQRAIGQAILEAGTSEEILGRMSGMLEELVMDAVACGAMRITPCTCCKSIRNLAPKWFSLREPFKVEWRCPQHMERPFTGKFAPFSQMHLDRDYMTHVFGERGEVANA